MGVVYEDGGSFAGKANCPQSTLYRKVLPDSEIRLHNRQRMGLLTNLDRLYGESKRNKWLGYFAVFCRLALALGFIPAGLVKVWGERFTALPSNHPLGHYFDALYLTGYYYTFIGIGQLLVSLLLIIPRTALLGAIIYFRASITESPLCGIP